MTLDFAQVFNNTICCLGLQYYYFYMRITLLSPQKRLQKQIAKGEQSSMVLKPDCPSKIYRRYSSPKILQMHCLESGNLDVLKAEDL